MATSELKTGLELRKRCVYLIKWTMPNLMKSPLSQTFRQSLLPSFDRTFNDEDRNGNDFGNKL